MVWLYFRLVSFSRSMTSSLVLLSRFPVGSSARMMFCVGGVERTEKIYCVIFRATSTSMQCRCGIPLLVQSKICSSIFSIFQS